MYIGTPKDSIWFEKVRFDMEVILMYYAPLFENDVPASLNL